VGEAVNRLGAEVLKAALSALLMAPEFIQALKDLGARMGMRLKGYRSVKVHLGSGQSVEVVAPYFVKAVPKGRRRARRPGSYLGLEVLGFVRRCSPRLVSEVAQAALLCPSFEVAHAVLERRGLEVEVKTLRCLCRVLFAQGAVVSRQDFTGGHRGARRADACDRHRWRAVTRAPSQTRPKESGSETPRLLYRLERTEAVHPLSAG
jgi:hypothetical protein